MNITQFALVVSTLACLSTHVHAQSADAGIRINVGGPTIASPNGDWASDTGDLGATSGRSFRSQAPVSLQDIDDDIPAELFNSARWDAPGGDDMQWHIPVAPGRYDVRLYFAETWLPAAKIGARTFDLTVENTPLNDVDIFAEAGAANRAIVRSLTVDADATLDIHFEHKTENPTIQAIHVLPVAQAGEESSTDGAANQQRLRINVGGPEIEDASGNWLASTGLYSPNTGATYRSGGPISVDDLPEPVPAALFNTAIWDRPTGPALAWDIPVTPGEYRVQLYFAETWVGAQEIGVRRFNVRVEDQGIDDVDIYALGGANNAVVHSVSVSSDDTLNIRFEHVAQNPQIQAIDIIPVNLVDDSNTTASEPVPSDAGTDDANNENDAPTTSDSIADGDATDDSDDSAPGETEDSAPSISAPIIRINAGGPTIDDPSGPWQGDDTIDYVNTGFSYRNTSNINLSALDEAVPSALFNTERWDPSVAPAMQWQIPVTSGQYRVNLFFAETWSGGQRVGARVFDVSVQDQTLHGLDVFAEAGANAALKKSFDVSADAFINIHFAHDVQNPTIKAIEIIPLDRIPNRPPVLDAQVQSRIELGDVLDLTAAVTDDGIPEPVTNITWSQVSGPSTAVIADPTARSTQAYFAVAGTYVLQLEAYDGALTTSERFTVLVGVQQNIRLDANRSWAEIASDSPTERRVELGAVSVDGTIYALGGMISRQRTPVTTVERFDPVQQIWESISEVPEPMNHFQPVAHDGKIYVLGALKGTGFPEESGIAEVHIYNTRTNTWSSGGSIPAHRVRGAAGAAVYQDKIYLVGGNPRGHQLGSVDWFDEYDPVTGVWRELPPLPHARDHVTVAIAGDRLVVAGGRAGGFSSSNTGVVQTDVYRFDTGEWVSLADDIPTPRSGAMAVAVGDEVVIIGGESSRTRSHDDVEALNVHTGEWRRLQRLVLGRHASGATISNGAIHIVAGNLTKGLGEETDSHEVLEFD